MEPEHDLVTWHLIDSAFPSGSLAHSGGLESAIQHHLLVDHESLSELINAMLQQVAYASLPLVLAAYRTPDRFAELDLFCDAFLTNHVANRASRAQGATFLTAARQIFESTDISRLSLRLRSEKLPGHFTAVFGVVAKSLDLGEFVCGQAFLFVSLRSLVSAAVRLGAVGPLEAQRLQLHLTKQIPPLIESLRKSAFDEIAQTSPFLDMLQGNQDRLYSRLFQS
jgi:urease accessory protein